MGMSQAQVAGKLEITRQSLGMYEKGERTPDIDVFAKVVKLMGCSPYYLLGIEEEDCMVLRNINGKEATFANDQIDAISFPYAFEIMDDEDCAGNGVKPRTTLICIALKDGEIATYAARSWCIVEI